MKKKIQIVIGVLIIFLIIFIYLFYISIQNIISSQFRANLRIDNILVSQMDNMRVSNEYSVSKNIFFNSIKVKIESRENEYRTPYSSKLKSCYHKQSNYRNPLIYSFTDKENTFNIVVPVLEGINCSKYLFNYYSSRDDKEKYTNDAQEYTFKISKLLSESKIRILIGYIDISLLQEGDYEIIDGEVYINQGITNKTKQSIQNNIQYYDIFEIN